MRPAWFAPACLIVAIGLSGSLGLAGGPPPGTRTSSPEPSGQRLEAQLEVFLRDLPPGQLASNACGPGDVRTLDVVLRLEKRDGTAAVVCGSADACTFGFPACPGAFGTNCTFPSALPRFAENVRIDPEWFIGQSFASDVAEALIGVPTSSILIEGFQFDFGACSEPVGTTGFSVGCSGSGEECHGTCFEGACNFFGELTCSADPDCDFGTCRTPLDPVSVPAAGIDNQANPAATRQVFRMTLLFGEGNGQLSLGALKTGADCAALLCGNGVMDPGEACDDGNETDGDGCSACALPVCGDGITDEEESCDDASANGTPSSCCSASCAAIVPCSTPSSTSTSTTLPPDSSCLVQCSAISKKRIRTRCLTGCRKGCRQACPRKGPCLRTCGTGIDGRICKGLCKKESRSCRRACDDS